MSENYFDRIRNVYAKLNSMFFKYENEVLGALMATLSRENYLLVGPPGTAKTTLVYALSKLLNAKWFYRQLTKFTDLEEILGPINIAKLLDGKVERIYANSIVESEFALLDEIFNASSAILNTLLSILNERVVYDGEKVVPVRTWTVFGASNRIPDEEELQALYDRFPLRVFTEWVSPDDTEPLIIKGWELRMDLERMEPLATMDDVQAVNKIITQYVYDHIKDISKIISPIIANYVEHIPISNRTRVKVPMYVATYLMLHGIDIGRAELTPSLLRVGTIKVLRYLVNNKDQLNEYTSFATVHMPEDLLRLSELLSEAKALINNEVYDEARQRIRDAKELLNQIRSKWDAVMVKLYTDEINELEDLLKKLEEALSESRR
ncbi:AAA family ATPase [Vulcanisaeta distributa]|uniref:ATPase associated with various cellular activities AAA_5 n=1 Tax=Vulcanisaeta distributa (strain DSM 14429 / JCM 11212 / NBRC 100878 / IC-017) TaxID=572478 RepID=E1QS87_VULDI|nr:AAA family ATPase [Vulcanisaeta distributa]ADN49480.1 ATPase associated with various cellular activities AAA_5 [Vulcanisaeta distributa DSM 14429]